MKMENRKGIIIYRSKYGATEKYAGWISEKTGFEMVRADDFNWDSLEGYDVIIYGGGIYAAGIAGIKELKKRADKLKKKRMAVFAVGASPYDDKAFSDMYSHNFKGVLEGIKCFYFRGAWDEEKMTVRDRTLCRLLQKSLRKKPENEREPWEAALMEAAGKKKDWSDRYEAMDLIEYVRS